ncbi:hypothetical protein BAUCODRAFT_150497 [Baudoinia panamericana UAMH 10762]|uniref:SWI5-dependent HO expression protein 3 n=1 Tax=Baudoinia panamericana (strain UAMH 10762) TaxID=717646 RepID=M2M9M6_BAUPA|nr:uncharacterized protein BAUCODRAFT_150497 [Baudoinia panamericana UAMH 10762]EMC93126.1 hypothetical protein BAUCODRAFT_150497 [Baudoinia panamericana UAMH 10762]
MKSRNSSPQSSPQVLRRIRVDGVKEDASAPSGSPNLRFGELPTLRKMSGLSPYPMQTNGRDTSPQPGLLQPIPHGAGSRRVSGEMTPSRLSLNGHVPSSCVSGTVSASPASAENESPAQWSSAIGHATTAGKSGRVIERLMAENDKLKRELELANLRALELEKSLSMYRPQMEALKQENENLSHARGVDSTLIGRRDRKIEELKNDCAVKDERLRKLEELTKHIGREAEDAREEHAREMQSLVEQTKHATVNAEIWETSHKQLRAEYLTRKDQWERDLKGERRQRELDRQRMAKLDVVHEQMRQESERGGKIQAELMQRWEALEDAMRLTINRADGSSEQLRVRSEEMVRLAEQMRWVMNVYKSTGGGERKDSRRDSLPCEA